MKRDVLITAKSQVVCRTF